MRISDVQRGKPTALEVVPASKGDFGPLTAMTEVELFSSGLESEALIRVGEAAWAIDGANAHQQELLEGVLLRALPRVAWIAARHPNDEKVAATSLVIEVREFPSENVWPQPVDLGVDEKIVEHVRGKRRSLTSISDVIAWLEEQILVKDAGGSARVLLSGSPNPQADQRSAFRLYGRGWAIDVARDTDDRLQVTRVVEAKRAQNDDERRPVLLVRGQFRFVDYTMAGRFRGTARSELDQIVAEADSYLAIWREYNKLERRSIQRRAREFGWLSYHSRQPLADGRWRFHLEDDERLEDCMRSLEETESVDLEAAASPPAELTEATDLGAEPADTSNGRHRIFAGECVGHDRRRLTLDLRLPAWNDEDRNPPPDKGVLFMSLGGDRTRLERRKKAQALIASAECPMPQLGLLIEGKVVPERRRRMEKPLSATAREAFGGEPTGRQVEALKIALNTPDITLIQGPPGTGKTRTIAALQARLSELSEDTDGVSGRYLLTSYQHDAVENVASATQVFGLPAIKVGRKRGQTDEADGFERWRQERVDAVRAKLAMGDELPAAVALRRCRDLAVGYLQAPSRAEDVSNLLTTVRDIAAPHVPPVVSDRLLELTQQLRRPTQTGGEADPDVEQTLKAVRGLRCSTAAFSDDGYTQARKALRRLQRLAVLHPDEEALLEQAASWDVEDEPGFLPDLCELQGILIDRLMPDQRPASAPMVSEDVEVALGAVVDALREAVSSSPGRVEAVLHEFCDDLENDRAGTRDTVEKYTVVLAATCQQAVGYQMSLRKGESNVFETVVVDEAARANPLDLFIPMALAERRIILVGDHRQLPHILDHEIENDLDADVSAKTQEMLRTSLFQRLFAQLQERERSDGIKRTVTLDVQYRMHPVLGDFVSDTFYAPYGEGFSSGRPPEEFAHNLTSYEGAVAAWVDVPLGHGAERRGQSKSRTAEAKWIAQEAHRLMTERPDLSVGVISFYSAQVNEVLRQMEPLGMTEQLEDGSYRIHDSWKTTRGASGKLTERLRVGTVDAFQGKEFDIVLLSMTRSNDIVADQPKLLRRKYGHLMLENRLCVAMSRQKRLLVVVGDGGMVKDEQAARAVPGLVQFLKLCGGDHGIQLHA
ncbi:MAG: AAA domain-containing protein [Deferrisomatales bacterium]|nr:AAA domain-containing protein [Deferrisomatales bacterium]